MAQKQDLAISVVLAVFGAALILGSFQIKISPILAFQDPVGASGFAFWVGVGMLVLASVQAVRQVRAMARGSDTAPDPGDDPRYPASPVRAFVVMALTAAYVALLSPGGYLVATPIFVSTGFFVMGGRGVPRLVVFPIAMAIVAYLTFDTLLRVRLPPGIAAPLLELIGLE